MQALGPESERLLDDASRARNWKRWGPYLAERQWSTVREDYSAEGEVWSYFPHDHARSRAYRWGEDGLLGFSDRQCRLCLALCLWNGRDPILKERSFGLAGPDGNHGEDLKECYFYLDGTPTHSYMKALYKYPQAEFPYARLLAENRRRGLDEPEFELEETGVFDGGRYFDAFVEYAKAGPDDILMRIRVVNRAAEAAELHLLPTLWFRNNWSWGCSHEGCGLKPVMELARPGLVAASHESLGRFRLAYELESSAAEAVPLFTDNHTNFKALFGADNDTPYTKDAFHEYVIGGAHEAVNPRHLGTKFAPYYKWLLAGGAQVVVRLRLTAEGEAGSSPDSLGAGFDDIFSRRIAEADEFYAQVIPAGLSAEEKNVSRQSYAGLLWTKQFYHYVVKDWLGGDTAQPTPPRQRLDGRNSEWRHFFARDIISMPDKWEYPWFAAWDTAFHMVAFARIDAHFAKQQLGLFLREWYMHPNGQLPAYEFAFGDVNPPVHAWAAWRVYKMTGPCGGRDRAFLESVFQKLLINFTWWVNRKDTEGNNLFSGGFLGLDNIGVFDRSRELPTGGFLQQADGTAWMAFYCLTMLAMSIELAEENPVYQDLASKFFEHFILIADAINEFGGTGLWDEEDGFYYDQLKLHGREIPLRTRSLVGLIPVIAVEVLDEELIQKLPGFARRMNWFLRDRQDLARIMAYCDLDRHKCFRLLSIPSEERLKRILRYLLDESEFLSPHGIRSLSRIHGEKPYVFREGGSEYRVEYVPGEGNSVMFGGNSNWRGPIWFPINYLLVEALERYDYFYGDSFKVECPVGSGRMLTLKQVSDEIARRLISIFMPDGMGRRPFEGNGGHAAGDEHWRGLLLFHEFFHGETGRGLGANHQTGWTALVSRFLEQTARRD